MMTSRHAWQPLIEEIEAANAPEVLPDVPKGTMVLSPYRDALAQRPVEWNCAWIDNAAMRRLFTEAHKWQS